MVLHLQDGRFFPGTTGKEWPLPQGLDQQRIEKKTGARNLQSPSKARDTAVHISASRSG